MTFNILLSGGIGTKILRLIAGCGEAIERGIKPEEICLIDSITPAISPITLVCFILIIILKIFLIM